MAVNKRLIGAGATAAAGGLTPSEHFGVVLYEGDGTSSHSINGGKFGAGAYFRGGTSNNISLDIDLTTTKTISMWVKNNSFPAYNVHLIRPSTNNLNFGFLQSSRTVFLWDGNSTQNWGYAIPNDTNFHHLVLAIDGTNAKLYVDNDDKGSITIVANSQTQLTLGKDSATNGLDGVMDQVRIFQKQLSSSEVSTLYAETADTVTSLDPLSEDTTDTLQVLGDTSCIATYRFENNEDDESGNFDGTGVNVQYAAGRYGQAASFNGSSSYVGLPDLSSTTAGSSATFSASFWIKPNNLSGVQSMIQLAGNDTTFTHFVLQASGSSMQMDFYGVAQSFSGQGSLVANQWQHIVIVNNGSSATVYLNTTASSAITHNKTYAGSYAMIGGRYVTGSLYSADAFDGKIDQVRIFNKALSASEVTTLYQENSLVASYRFEGNANDDMRAYDGSATNVSYEYGLNFTPDFVWIKNRTYTNDHGLYDSSRGATKYIAPNTTGAEATYSTVLTSFDTGGFTFGSNPGGNRDGDDFVAWCLKANGGTTSSNTDGSTTTTVQANQDAGFSIVSDSAGGPNTYGHGLSQAPEMIIAKTRLTTGDWYVYHKDLNGGTTPENYFIKLNSTDAEIFNASSGGSIWNSTAPTSTVFSYGTTIGNAIAYCFHSVDGFSKIGSYTGNGSSNIIETGFEPAFVMFKRTNAANNWLILDNKRNTSNPRNCLLIPNATNVEDCTDAAYNVNFLSNGFELLSNGTSINDSGGTYIFMAFAADPDTEAPTVAKSFSTVAYTGDGSTRSIDGLGFEPSLTWIKGRTNTASHQIFDTIRGATKGLNSDANVAEFTNTSMLTSFDSDGFTLGGQSSVNGSGVDYVAWAWKADDNESTIEQVLNDVDAKAIYTLESNANDVTGNYNATASGITYSSGKFGNAATYSGTNASSGSKIYVSNNVYGSSTSVFSVSLWIKCTNTSGEIPIAGNGGTIGGTQGYALYLNSGSLALTFRSSNGNQDFYYGSSINDNSWHHLVLTFNNGPYALYLDGLLELSGTTTNFLNNTTPSFDTYFGNRWNRDESGVIAGQIDQIRIYDSPLTAASVTNLYNETQAQNSTLDIGTKTALSIQSIVSANANAGFSIVKFQANSTNAAPFKVPHGLSAAPDLIIVKDLDNAVGWHVYSSVFSTPAQSYLQLNSTAAALTGNTNIWDNTAATSTVFSMKSGYAVTAGANCIAYCFHSVSGYSKIGSYTGNGSGSGQTITTGFQPDWIILKCTSVASEWVIVDSVRGDAYLLAESSGAEVSPYTAIDFLSTGFKLTGTSYNESGRTFIYWTHKIN